MVTNLKGVERRQAILAHIARYTFSLRIVIERLYFDGKSCDAVLMAMAEDGLVVAQPNTLAREVDTAPDTTVRVPASGSVREDTRPTVIPGGYKYYQLTLKAAKSSGLPSSRTKPPGPGAFDRHLAVLWFCCMGKQRLNLLNARNVAKLFGEGAADSPPIPEGPYCVELEGKHRIFRVFTPGVTAKDLYHIENFQSHLEEAMSHPILHSWLQTRRLAYAFLVPHDDRRKKLKEQIKATGVHDTIWVDVVTVPTHQTLDVWLRTKPQPKQPQPEPKAQKKCLTKTKRSPKSKGPR